eukprot:COSAG03_NODE_9964_length_681_cov_2.070447_1_plen_27_part_10
MVGGRDGERRSCGGRAKLVSVFALSSA